METATQQVAADISWKQFVLLFVAMTVLNGGVRYAYGELNAPGVEQALFYLGHTFGSFLFAAVIVAPLHLIGKKMTTGMEAPKKWVAIWGSVWECMLLARFILGQ